MRYISPEQWQRPCFKAVDLFVVTVLLLGIVLILGATTPSELILTGSIVDDDGGETGGLQVKLIPKDNDVDEEQKPPERSTVTEAGGRFEFDYLYRITYELQVSRGDEKIHTETLEMTDSIWDHEIHVQSNK